MSLVPFLAVAFAAGAAALLTRHRADVSGALGVGGLALAALAGVAAPILAQLGVPPADAAVTAFLTLGALCALLVVLAGAGVGTVPRSVPGAWLLTLGTAGIALLAPTPTAAVLLATGAGVIAVVPVLDPGAASERGAMAAAIAVRMAVLAAVAGLAATVLQAVAPGDAGVAGVALVAVASGVAVRLGVIPLHRPAARLAALVAIAPLALVALWGPVTLAWIAPGLVPADVPPLERAVVLVLALVAIVLAGMAALLHDDLPHVIGYGIALDGGVAIVALTAAGLAEAPLHTWLLAVAVARTALVGWAIAVGGPAGVRRIGELRGWARRSPLLAVALLATGVALIAWPGSAAWEARADVLAAGVGGPLARFGGAASAAAGVASAAAIARLLVVGAGRPEPGAPRDVRDPDTWRIRVRLATVSAMLLAALALVATVGWVG